ncbi:MAG: hypothetical protein IKJ07_08010 [Clostridia bacterium]|nr:hypothetical protein [Clostridia bacterium]
MMLIRRTFTIAIAFIFLVGALAFQVNVEACENEASITTTYVQGRKGSSVISYNPMSYQNCKGALYIQGSTFEYDESGVLPVITVDSQTELSFSYNASHIRALADDPTQRVLDIDLGASVRSGAIIVQQKTDNDFDTVSIATDVFREDAASLAGFFKPAYADILKGATYRIIVAYATVSKNLTQIQRTIEIYEVKLQVNSTGVSFIENLPDNVIVDLLGDVGSAEALDLYRAGGTLLSESVTPYGFTVKLQNQATDVQVSYNGGAYKTVVNNIQFTTQGRYSFRITTCHGDVEERIIYITPPKESFVNAYFPDNEIIKGERLFDLASDLPVWSLNSKIELSQSNQFLSPLYGSLVNLDSGEEQTISPSSNTLHLNQSGRYFLALRNVPSENTPGTHCVFSYVFRISSPSDTHSTLNLKNLRSNNEISAYKALHYEVDITHNGQLIHLIFSSRQAAESVAKQNGTIVVARCFDYSQPKAYDFSRYNNPDFQEAYVFANSIERELCRSTTQLIPSDFTYVPCESVEVRAFSYSSGETKLIHFGIPIGEQLFEGRWHITEVLSSGKSINYDVFYANVNRISYSLHYDDTSYTVSGEMKHCVNYSQGPISVTDILNRWDAEGIIKIESATDTLLLPIAQTTDITLEGGFYRLQFIDRLGQMVELDVNVASSALTNLIVAENPVTSDASTVSEREYYNNTMFIVIGSICGMGCCCGSINYIQKMRRKRK